MNKEHQKYSAETVDKMYFYERFAEVFDAKMNMYDTLKRVEVIYDELLKHDDLRGKTLLDAGCGTGFFSLGAHKRGAKVTALDLGERLLAQVKKKCDVETVVGSILELPFPDNHFDYVVSSEVIEHVPDPEKALSELYRVCKPNGILVVTTPNMIWYWAVVFANAFKLRPYEGLENWTWWNQMKGYIKKLGGEIIEMKGIHLFPFIFPVLNPVLNFFHRFSKPLGPIMINMAVKVRKK